MLKKNKSSTMNKTHHEKLIDKFNRHINYVRISVTDRCDFRCTYCMSEKMQFVPRAKLVTLEEIAFIAQAFTELGVEKIRITGGEPLIRKNIIQLFENIGKSDSKNIDNIEKQVFRKAKHFFSKIIGTYLTSCGTINLINQ